MFFQEECFYLQGGFLHVDCSPFSSMARLTHHHCQGHTSWLSNWAENYGISLLPCYGFAISLILVVVLCVCKMTDRVGVGLRSVSQVLAL